MADNFIDAVKKHTERLANLQAPPPLDPPPLDLEAIWEGLGPAIAEELQANNIKVVRHIQGNA